MSDLPHQKRHPISLIIEEEEQAGQFTRRTVLAGAAAATAMVSVGAIDAPAYSHSADPSSEHDMVAFVLLSAALTGIAPGALAPGFTPPKDSNSDVLNSDPGSDPVNIKRDYFNWVNERHAATFENLLQIVKDNRGSANLATTIIEKVATKDDTLYLGRSIVLMWYLGSWYEPSDLKMAPPSGAFIPSAVVSAKAYTQGWIWRIAQAHPMGYSELQFGYWSREPIDPNDLDEHDNNRALAFISDRLR